MPVIEGKLIAPLCYYTSFSNSPLLFHLLNVGEGLMNLIVYPDQTTMLLDCNVREEEKEIIIAYLENNIPPRYDSETKKTKQWIDIFVNSHRDQDHYRGLKYVNGHFPVRSIWDSGQRGEAMDSDDYKYYMALRRSLKERYGKNAVRIPIPSLSPIGRFGGANVYCLCSGQEFEASTIREAKAQHSNSIVLSVHYAARSILLTGDSDWLAWRDKIVPHFEDSGLLKSNLLVASHHGSRSFFTDEELNEDIDPDSNPDTTYVESIEYIEPSITLIPCGTYSEAHHPNKDALQIYKDNSANAQVYSTYDKGNLVGFIDCNGRWTIAPARFCYKSNTNNADFTIKAKYEYDYEKTIVNSNDSLKTGGSLEFSIESRGQLIEPFLDVTVWWEVSNGGINYDHERQDIYYKGKDEKEDKLHFRRALAYEGKHLLRCRIKNKKKMFDITKVFVVNGTA